MANSYTEGAGENPLRPRATGAPTTERTVAAAHRSIDALGARAHRSEESLRTAAATSADRYEANKAMMRAQMTSTIERTRSYMQEHPFVAASTAFAAGAILTALLSKRPED